MRKRRDFLSRLYLIVGPVAQLVSAPPCHGGGRGFKSRLGRDVFFRLGSSVGTSVRLKIVRSTVRSRPQPLQITLPFYFLLESEVFKKSNNISIQINPEIPVKTLSNSKGALEIATAIKQ